LFGIGASSRVLAVGGVVLGIDLVGGGPFTSLAFERILRGVLGGVLVAEPVCWRVNMYAGSGDTSG
jgi:hypothetical protein